MDAQISNERRIFGRAVSRGIGVGEVACLFGTRRQFFRIRIAEGDVEAELEKLDLSLSKAISLLEGELERSAANTVSAISEILQTHKLILTDPTLRTAVRNNISTELVNAEWAVQSACDEIASRFSAQTETHLNEKRLDLEDVCDRLLACLGSAETELELPARSIIVAKEVSPSMFIRLASKGIAGVISEGGGWTSHTSILARELEIPAVTGLANIFDHFKNGTIVLLNGFSGEVIIDPSNETVSRADDTELRGTSHEKISVSRQRTATIDGHEIRIRTNTTNSNGYRTAMEFGATGIGLYRSESLLGPDGSIPNEDEQAAKYSEISTTVGHEGVRIRTFDIDASQFEPTRSLRQKNPALGLRSVRLGLTNIDLLKTQIRALLRAAHNSHIGLVIPMVSGVSDVEVVRTIVETETADLERSKTPVGRLDIGAMIEVPASVLVVDQLARACDFLCLGTNDLAQYMLAADRDNETVSRWFRTLHPAMLRAVKRVIVECQTVNKPLVVCGEMAGSPFYVPVLIGLGATELSMNPTSIEAVRRVIVGIEYKDAAELARTLEQLSDTDEIESVVLETARSKWQHLFTRGFLEMHNT